MQMLRQLNDCQPHGAEKSVLMCTEPFLHDVKLPECAKPAFLRGFGSCLNWYCASAQRLVALINHHTDVVACSI